jgi:glutamine synthetase
MDPFFGAADADHVLRHLEPSTGQPYNRDPRSIAKKAEAYLKSAGIGDTAYSAREAEFFIFDDVRYTSRCTTTASTRSTSRKAVNAGTKDYEGGNMGHRPRSRAATSRSRRSTAPGHARRDADGAWREMGVEVEKHHHEVAPAQHELGMKFGTLLKMPTTCRSTSTSCTTSPTAYGKTATFMPKPI